MTFSREQLNFFKFSSVVLDEFPVALRGVFIFMWDNLVASPPGVPKWDDSIAVRSVFLAKEGGKTKYVPTSKSIKEWDCTALFEATLFAKTFAMPSTLHTMYIKPRGLSAGTFHPSVISPTGNQAETYALALDQLRLLRNTLCHQISTQEIDKATFDNYILLAKDALTALGQITTRVVDIGKLAEEDFPTSKQRQLQDELKKEKDAAITFRQIDDHLTKIESQVKDVGSNVKDVKTNLIDLKTQVEVVGSDVKDVKTQVTDVKTQVKDTGSDLKDLKTEVADVKTQVEDVRLDVKIVKTKVADVNTQVKDVGSEVKDVKTEVTDVKTKVEDVGSDVKDVKTEVTDVKTQVKDVGSDLNNVKTEVTDVKAQVKDVESDVKDVKTEVTDVKTQVKYVKSDVKDVKNELTDVKRQVGDVGSHVKDVKTEVTDVKTQVNDFGSHVKDVKTEVTDVKAQVEDVRSDLKDVKTEVKDVKTQIKDVCSNVKTEVRDLKTEVKDGKSEVKMEVTDVKTQVEDVGSEVKDVKTEVRDVKAQVKDVLSDVKDVKSEVTYVKTEVKNVGSDLENVKTEVTDMKTKVENVASGMRELKTDVTNIKQALEEESAKGHLFPDSCIPDKTPHFVGRQEECQAILDHLTKKDTRLVDVWGPPGFGKTSVAINVAHHLRERKIPVYFTSLRGMKSKDDLVSKLLSIFADAKQAFYVSPSDWLIQCLQQLQDPLVLILDNADDLLEFGDAKRKEELVGFTQEILSQCNHVKLLFTTRESLDYLRHKHLIHLEKVTELDDDSADDLVRLLLDNVSDDDCKRIVKECGRVPMAMRLMCSIMSEENVSVNELLEELKISPLVEVLDNEGFLDDFRLKTIINTSFQRLTDHEKCALVSLVVFHECFGIEEATAVLDLKTVRQTKKVIRSLERKSLIDCGQNFASFTIHSLLRSFIDNKIATDQESAAVYSSAQHRFNKYYISNFEEVNKRFLSGHSNEALLTFLPQRKSIIMSLTNGTRDDKLYSKAVDALSMAELFLYALLPANEEIFNTIYDTAVKEAKKRKNMNDERKLKAAKSFGHWGWFSSDGHTWDHFLQTSCSHSAEWPAKLVCYFGIHQLLCGKLDEGISSLKSAVDRLSSSCDETVLKQLVYQMLSVTYLRKQEYKTVSYFQNLCRIEAKASSACVGKLLLCSSDFRQAMKDDGFLFSVTSALLCVSGKRKSTHLGAFCAFGEAMKNVFSGKIEDSLEHMEGVLVAHLLTMLELRELNLAPDDTVGVLLKMLSSLDISNDDRSPNWSWLNQLFCVERNWSIWGEIASLLSPYWFKQLKMEIEDPLEEENLNDLGEEDIEILARRYDLKGKWLLHSGYFSEAMESHQRAIALRKEKIGNHVDTAASLSCIGCVHFKMNNESEAIKSFQSAFELRKQLAIYDHVDTANIYNALGENHLTLKNYEKAIEAHLQALELRKKHLGEDPLTGESLHHIAVVNLAKASYKEALAYCQQALAMRLKLFSEHVDTADSLHLLGEVQYKMRDFLSAIETFQKASDMRSNLLGDHAKETAKSYYWLGLAQYKMGNFEGTDESLQKVSLLRMEVLDQRPGVTDVFDEVFQDIEDAVSKCQQSEVNATRLHNVALEIFQTGCYTLALWFCQDALTAELEALKQYEGLAKVSHDIAVTYLNLAWFSQSRKYLWQALKTKRALVNRQFHLAETFQLLGEIYFNLVDLLSAVWAFKKAVDMKYRNRWNHIGAAQDYHCLGELQLSLMSLDGALKSFQKASVIRKCILGDHLDTAQSFSKIGCVHYKMGDYQSAKEDFQNALDLHKKLLNKHESTATCFQNLAVTCLCLEIYPEALEFCKQALTMRLELLGEHVVTADNFHTLGSIYFKMSDYQSAAEAFQRTSVMRLNLLGEHKDTALSFHTLGSIYFKMSDYPSAAEAFQRASSMRSNLLGDNKDTALSYQRLGKVQQDMGDFVGALKSFQKASRMRKKVLGDHLDTAQSFSEIGCVHYKMGDYKSAKIEFHCALHLFKKLLGNHKGTATSLHNLAVTYFHLEIYPEALKFSQQALTMRLQLLGEHVVTAGNFHTLGSIYFKMSDYQSAAKAFQRASNMRSNLLGDHKDTALSYNLLGKAQQDMGDFVGALKSFQKAFRIRKVILSDHLDTAESLNAIGCVHYKMGDYQSAKNKFQRALDLFKQLLGKHESTATSCHNLAVTYLEMGKYAEALELCQQALNMRLELLGEHVVTAYNVHTLGSIYFKMSDHPSAVKAFQRASVMRSNLLGDHEDTALSYYWLGVAQLAMGRLKGALRFLQKSTRMRKTILGDHPDTAESIKLRKFVSKKIRSISKKK